MEADDPRPADPLRLVEAQDLDALSPAECDMRVERLTAEIARTERRRAVAVAHRSGAEGLFKG